MHKSKWNYEMTMHKRTLVNYIFIFISLWIRILLLLLLLLQRRKYGYNLKSCILVQMLHLHLFVLQRLDMHLMLLFLHSLCLLAFPTVFRLKHLDDMLSSACQSAEDIYKVLYWDNHTKSSRFVSSLTHTQVHLRNFTPSLIFAGI